jgi:hypothetical protein
MKRRFFARPPIFQQLYILLFTSVLVFSLVTSFAQKSTGKILLDLDSLFVEGNKMLSNEKDVFSNDFALFLSNTNRVDSSIQFDEQKLLAAKQAMLKRDIGLKLNSNYLNNQNTNAFSFDDNVMMRTRSQTEIEWNLLKGGLIENRSTAKALQYRGLIESQMVDINADRSIYVKRFNLVIQLFNRQKLALLYKRKSLIERLIANEEVLFKKKQLKKEDFLIAKKRLAEIDALIQVYDPYNMYSPWKEEVENYKKNIPVFDINYPFIFQRMEATLPDSVRDFFEKEASFHSRWYNQINLATFTRYNFYDYFQKTATNQSKSYFSIGATLSVPLTFNHGKKKEVRQLEIDKKLQDFNRNQHVFQEELLNEMYEFKYKQHQYVSFLFKREGVYDRVKLEDVKRNVHYTYFSPLHALILQDDVLAVDMELIELKQNLYLKLISIQSKLPNTKLEELIKPLDMTAIKPTIETSDKRSIYIWSSIFEKQSIPSLLEEIENNKFNNAIIAYQKEGKYVEQKEELMSKLVDNNCSVELLIGLNNLLFEKDLKGWFSKTFSNYPMDKISAIHLDVEPHTLKEWKANKAELLKKYLVFLKEVKGICDTQGVKLMVSIPTIYPKPVVDEIYSLVDGVYFMCYENVSITHLQKKLIPYTDFVSKTHVALRTEDFKSTEELNNFIDTLKGIMPFKNFVIHDLKRWMELEQK